MNPTSDTVVEEVRQELLERSEVGIRKYNATLDRKDVATSQWIKHAREEAMDFTLYLTRLQRDMVRLEKIEAIARDLIYDRDYGLDMRGDLKALDDVLNGFDNAE
jgi:hypothetical protein